MLGQHRDTARYEAGPKSTRIPKTFPQDQCLDPNLVSLRVLGLASRRMERAMGIEPTREALPKPENMGFPVAPRFRCDWRVNFRGMWGHVRLRRETSVCEVPGSSLSVVGPCPASPDAYAHPAWPCFSISFNVLHPSALAARARRLPSASAKQRRPHPCAGGQVCRGHLGQPHCEYVKCRRRFISFLPYKRIDAQKTSTRRALPL